VRAVEVALACLLAAGGLRSAWRWARRPLEGADLRDHLLYAAYLTGRIGLWFAFAGYFVLAASIRLRGRAAGDELARYRWYALVPIALAALQLLAGLALGRRPSVERDERETIPPRSRGEDGSGAP